MKTAEQRFVVYCVLPPSEREAVEEARRRLGARGWGGVLAAAWRYYKERELANGKEEGNCVSN